MCDDPPGVGIIRRKLGQRVRQMREQHCMKQEQVAHLLERSRPTLWKIESGRPQVTIRHRDIVALCELYGTAEKETELLLALTTATRVRGWATTLTDLLPADYDLAADLENDAASICQYADRLIPDLLQTEGYARVVLARPDADVEETRNQAADQLARRRLLTRRVPVHLDVVLAESTLRQVVGGTQVMAYQYPRLLAMSELPAVRLRVLPAEAGLHQGLATGPFSLLRFPDGHGSPIAHSGGPRRSFWDRQVDVDGFDAAFADIARHTLDAEPSRDLIRLVSADVARGG